MDKKELEYFNKCNVHVHIKGNNIVVEEEFMHILFKDEKLLEYYILRFMPWCIERCIKR